MSVCNQVRWLGKFLACSRVLYRSVSNEQVAGVWSELLVRAHAAGGRIHGSAGGLPSGPKPRQPGDIRGAADEIRLDAGRTWYDAGEFFAAHGVLGKRVAEVTGAGEDVLARIDPGGGGFSSPRAHNPLRTALLPQAALRRLERYPAHFGGLRHFTLR